MHKCVGVRHDAAARSQLSAWAGSRHAWGTTRRFCSTSGAFGPVHAMHSCVGVSTSTPPYPCRNEDSDSSIDSGLELVAVVPVEDATDASHPWCGAFRQRSGNEFSEGGVASQTIGRCLSRSNQIIVAN